ELTRRVDAQQGTIAFLTTRLNQLEQERVLLLRQLTGLELPPPPQMAVTPRVSVNHDDPRSILEQVATSGIFDDDPAHAPAGWHVEGEGHPGLLAPRAAADNGPVPTVGSRR